LQFASRRYDGVERFAILSAALPLTWTFAHEHDLALALFPALLCFRRRSGTAWLIGALGTMLVAVDWLGFAQRPSGLAQSMLLASSAMLAIAVLGSERISTLRFAPAAIVALAAAFIASTAAIGASSRAHLLSIWPNALPAMFTAPLSLSAPQVWALEQHVSGIDTLDPWLGFLRGLSLLGCALLWYALSRDAHGGASVGDSHGWRKPTRASGEPA